MQTFTMDGYALHDALTSARVSADVRSGIEGLGLINLQVSDGYLRVLSTDRYRMTRATFEVDGPGGPVNTSVDAGELGEVLKRLPRRPRARARQDETYGLEVEFHTDMDDLGEARILFRTADSTYTIQTRVGFPRGAYKVIENLADPDPTAEILMDPVLMTDVGKHVHERGSNQPSDLSGARVRYAFRGAFKPVTADWTAYGVDYLYLMQPRWA